VGEIRFAKSQRFLWPVIADVTAHILGDLALEIPVERFRPAGEALAVVVGQQLDDEGRLQALRSSARRR